MGYGKDKVKVKEWGDPLFCIVTTFWKGEDVLATKKGGNTVETCRALAKPLADELGLVIWDVRFVKEGASWYLRYFIDKDGGVDINDCVALTRALNPVLDEADPIATSYTLEVSSPGIERELTRPEHFEWCEGDAVVVTLFAPKDGAREFAGILQPCDNGQIVITDENEQPLVFDKKEVSSIRLIEEWDDDTDETV